MKWRILTEGCDARMPCSFDVLHPGAEQDVLLAFEMVVALSKMAGRSDQQKMSLLQDLVALVMFL